MKCPKCLALCASSETVCHACRASLIPTPAPTLTGRVAAVSLLAGTLLWSALLPPWSPDRGFDLERALAAGLVGGASGLLGAGVGWLLSRCGVGGR
jgi:hypothetical protein